MKFFRKTLTMCHSVMKRIKAAGEISGFINPTGIVGAFIFFCTGFFLISME